MPYLSGPVLSVSWPYVSYSCSAVAHLKLVLDNCCWGFSYLNFFGLATGLWIWLFFFFCRNKQKNNSLQKGSVWFFSLFLLGLHNGLISSVCLKKQCFDTGDVKLCICVCIYCIRHIENKRADVDWHSSACRSEYSLLWLFFIMFIFVIVRSCPKKLVIWEMPASEKEHKPTAFRFKVHTCYFKLPTWRWSTL